MTDATGTAVLDGLRAVPADSGGFGQPTFDAFYAALVEASHRRAADGETPPVLMVMGEPLAGKSTFLSQLFVRLTGPHPPSPFHPTMGPLDPHGPMVGRKEAGGWGVLRPYLVRWGDTIRAAKQLGDVAPARQFGDLTPDEFARTSVRLAEAAAGAQRAAQGQGPALVVVEAPGVTMLHDKDGRLHGLDRGYSLAQALARQEHGFLVVLCADPRVRDTNLGRREALIATGGPEIREATQLAANRIHEQVTDLLCTLAVAGTVALPEPAPALPLTRERLDADPAYRTRAVLGAYLPYLLQHDLQIPPHRAFIGLNGFLEGGAAPDAALLDAYDWTHQQFGL